MFKKLSVRLSLILTIVTVIIMTGFTFFIVEDRSSQMDEMILSKGIASARTGAVVYGVILETAVENEIFSIDEIFDFSLMPVSLPDSILDGYESISDDERSSVMKYRYKTALDSYLDDTILEIEDEFLKDPQIRFAVGVDKNGYLPTHNTVYSKPLTGDFIFDRDNNRTKRIFNDPVGLKAAKNVNEPCLQQVYRRDTGEVMWDISSPIFVDGKHWGAFRIGYSMDAAARAISSLRKKLILSMSLLIFIIVLIINRVTASMIRPLASLRDGVERVAKGDLSFHQDVRSNDEIGDLARAFNTMTDDLNEHIHSIREERNLLQTLLENIPDIIFFKDKDDKYIRISSSLAKLLAKSPDEIVGKTVSEVFSPELAALKMQNDSNVIHAGEKIIDKEEVQPTSDGGERWLSTTKIPWYGADDSIVGMFGIARDITKRKMNEKQLEIAKNKFQELYDNAPVGYQQLDVNGNIVQVNKTQAVMLGYTVDELLGATVFDLIPAEQRDAAKARFHVRFEEPDKIARFERKYLRKDGSEIDLYIEDRVVFDENGKPVGLRATLQDISDLKKAQTELNRTVAAKERIESELQIAHDIQVSMLPRTFPPFPERNEFDLYAYLVPAKEVGGDFYDFFFVDEDHLCFCIGDVAGKGVPASLYMAVTRTLIKSKTSKGLTPDTVLARVNEDLSIDSTSMFVTIFCGILDVTNGDMFYANGGHNPPLLLRTGGECDFLNTNNDIAVGVIPDAAYSLHQMKLGSGDMLLLYTDGITEAINPGEEQYSGDRLRNALSRYGNTDVVSILSRIAEDVNRFVDSAPQFDDLTMLLMKYLG